MKKIVRIIVISVLALSLSACSLIFNTKSATTIATKIKKNEYFSSFKTGGLLLDTNYDYYSDVADSLDGYDEQSLMEAGDMSQEEAASFMKLKAVYDFLAANVPDVNDSKSGDITAAYVGTTAAGTGDNKTVNGLYIFMFKSDVSLKQADLDVVNASADLYEEFNYAPEYYVVSGKVLVAGDKAFLDKNGITLDQFVEAVNGAL